MLCHVMLCRTMWPVRAWTYETIISGYLRDHLLRLILFFCLIPHICPVPRIALTSFASVSSSQRCMSRVLILLETISPISRLSRSRVFQWFPTGLSFYFTFPTLPSSSIYLLLAKHADVVHAFQYLFYVHFCRFNSPTIPHVFLSNFIRRKYTLYIYRYLYTFFLFFAVKTRFLLVIRLSFALLRFFVCLELLRNSSRSI